MQIVTVLHLPFQYGYHLYLFFYNIFIGVKLLYNGVLVSAL